jgi:hypothetical protein
MKTAIVAGVLLIVLGVVSLVYQGITYTHQKKIVDLGPVHVTDKAKDTIPLPPILGGIALAGGVVLVIVGSRRKG